MVVMLDHDKTNSLSRYLDVVCIAGFKTADKPLTRAHRIKPPNALQAFAHGLDSNGYQIVQVALLSGDQYDWGTLIGGDGHIFRSTYHPGRPLGQEGPNANNLGWLLSFSIHSNAVMLTHPLRAQLQRSS